MRKRTGCFNSVNDVFSVSPYEIAGTEVMLTLLGGKEVHRAEAFAG